MSLGKKLYLPTNVYDAAIRRLEYVFSEFDNIVLSFSGGKDSGLLVNLVVRFMRERGITRKVGIFHQDFEAQYEETTRYVERVMTSNLDILTPYWVCLPYQALCATSMYQQHWTPWNPAEKDIWVRELPEHPGVIHEGNNPFEFFVPGMHYDDFYRRFGAWYHEMACGGLGKTACLVGIRSDESLNRWRAAAVEKKSSYQCQRWTTGVGENVWAAYPLYDWRVEDIWTANAKFGFDYNRLYDLFHYAGLSPHEMRVASPFNDFAIGTLALYRVVEPHTWAKLLGRVNGAHFASVYGGTDAVAWKNIKIPEGHTWKTYVEFLLKTLPEKTRIGYEEKFATSIKFWRDKGGCLSAETIAELRAMGIKIEERGTTNYKTQKVAVTFEDYPDNVEVKEFQSVPSYKRMAICILKNDHLCKYMGFSQTQAESVKRKKAMERWKDL